jgi:hypothetical protein
MKYDKILPNFHRIPIHCIITVNNYHRHLIDHNIFTFHFKHFFPQITEFDALSDHGIIKKRTCRIKNQI